MINLVHFADAHIDMARQGRRDPESGLPLRVIDFLKALDTIIDYAIQQPADLVIFAGDAYRDRTPAPTYQREWGRRMIRLSEAGIETILLVGNHDISPAVGRAHTLHEFDTLNVPHMHVVRKTSLLGPQDLGGLPVQVIGIPWMNRSNMLAVLEGSSGSVEDVNQQIEAYLIEAIEGFLDAIDPELPAILTSHISVQGAMYGNERSVMLGRDMVLSPAIVKDKRLDYVALGHIHKYQNLNTDGHHPIIYPGSIERVDFGEIEDDKFFISAQLDKGETTTYKAIRLQGRKFLSKTVVVTDADRVQEQIMQALPDSKEMADAMFRLILSYPREWEPMIDEEAIRHACKSAFEFYLVRRPVSESRLRLPDDVMVGKLTHAELLEKYWETINTESVEIKVLNEMAGDIIRSVEIGEDESDLAEENAL
jgi:DNA repair protein SbcD/Mre11